MEIAGVAYTSEIAFQNVQLGPVGRIFKEYSLRVYENNILLMAEMDEVEEGKLINLIGTDYNIIIYRISCYNEQTGEVFSISVQGEAYTKGRSSYSFVCEDEGCLKWLGQVVSAVNNIYEYQLDITTLEGTEIDVFVGFPLEQHDSCVSKAIALVDTPDNICVFLYITNKQECRVQGKEISVIAQIINPTLQEMVVDSFEMKHDFNDPVICLKCEGPCQGLGDPDTGILVQLEEGEKDIGVGYVVSHANYNYDIVKIVTFVCGALAIVGMLIDSIVKIVYFQKLCKEQKARRRNK